ncbi:polyhydroxyalkanoic acid system family protein [Arenicella xantha]|uniref:Putative polyhydroxyalkanoate system protein n=1 Tax=Arenicella xantha TaxID=644221 RepID=A0A395JI15_9GAMM|nr:polyhydroxyalkanoic acid system family protein [Arenicella xantha]RBP49726.1 putative polyhydroxyalkanoate system protein [Arenicella xantha]
MSHVQVCREVDLNAQECSALAETLLDKLVDKFGGSYRPQGDNYRYRHTAGVDATVEPKQGTLLVNVKLGFMTRALAPQLEAEMNRVLDEYLDV